MIMRQGKEQEVMIKSLPPLITFTTAGYTRCLYFPKSYINLSENNQPECCHSLFLRD